MKHHLFSPRGAAAAAVAGMAVLLAGGTATGAMAAVASVSVSVAQQSASTVPGAPTGLTATPGNGSATLSWSAPSSDGGSPVDFYVVQGGTSPSDNILEKVGGHATTTTIAGLTNGTVYFLSVHAQNASGAGPAVTVQVTPRAAGSATGAAPGAPAGLTARAGHGEVALSWSPPTGGLKNGDGYLIYMGTSPGGEGAKPSYPHLIENATSFTIAPLTNGTRYYFQVALLDGNNQVSARSAEVSAVPVAVAGAGPGSSASSSTGTQNGSGGESTQPTSPPRHDKGGTQHDATSSPPASLIIALAALSLAATGGAIAIVLIKRRRQGRGYAPVPAPRLPYDDQFNRANQSSGSRS